jgi:SpoVK/Ycf46/Vps4 family AAA+-type ATPase
MNQAEDMELEAFVSRLDMITAEDIKRICRKAVMQAVRKI